MDRANRKKIVHLSSVHRATDTRIFVKECRSLANAGFDVTLIARADEDAVVDGVAIRAVTAGTANRLRRMTGTVLEVARLARAEDGDAYHFHDPELIPVGLALKLRGKRIVYDVHENVAKQIRSKFWIPGALRTPVAAGVRALEHVAARLFDGVVAATPGISEVFPPSKTVVIQNFALLEEFLSIDSSDYAARPPQLVYVGALTRERGLEEMVRVMEPIGEKTGACLTLGGTFNPPDLERQVRDLPGAAHVKHLGWLDRRGVREVLAQSRIGLLLLHPEPNYVDSYPVKLFEYMAAGLPVVASDFPFWRQFVSAHNAGIMVDPHDLDAVAEAVLWLLTHPDEAREMGERGRAAAVSRYGWEQQAERLVDFYRRQVFREPAS